MTSYTTGTGVTGANYPALSTQPGGGGAVVQPGMNINITTGANSSNTILLPSLMDGYRTGYPAGYIPLLAKPQVARLLPPQVLAPELYTPQMVSSDQGGTFGMGNPAKNGIPPGAETPSFMQKYGSNSGMPTVSVPPSGSRGIGRTGNYIPKPWEVAPELYNGQPQGINPAATGSLSNGSGIPPYPGSAYGLPGVFAAQPYPSGQMGSGAINPNRMPGGVPGMMPGNPAGAVANNPAENPANAKKLPPGAATLPRAGETNDTQKPGAADKTKGVAELSQETDFNAAIQKLINKLVDEKVVEDPEARSLVGMDFYKLLEGHSEAAASPKCQEKINEMILKLLVDPSPLVRQSAFLCIQNHLILHPVPRVKELVTEKLESTALEGVEGSSAKDALETMDEIEKGILPEKPLDKPGKKGAPEENKKNEKNPATASESGPTAGSASPEEGKTNTAPLADNTSEPSGTSSTAGPEADQSGSPGGESASPATGSEVNNDNGQNQTPEIPPELLAQLMKAQASSGQQSSPAASTPPATSPAAPKENYMSTHYMAINPQPAMSKKTYPQQPAPASFGQFSQSGGQLNVVSH